MTPPLLVSMCILGLGMWAEPPAMSLESLGLPERIRVLAVHVPESGDSFDRHRVEESLTWVSGIQEMYQGDLGWSLADITYADAGQTLIYAPPSQRGNRSARYADTGTTRLDGMVTPYAWARYAKLAMDSGGTFETGEIEGRRAISFDGPAVPRPGRITCLFDAQTGELREVRREIGDETQIYQYSAWAPVCDGKRLPFRVDMALPMKATGSIFRKSYRIEEASCPSGPPPSPPRLPADAVITDAITGKVTSGDGRDMTLNQTMPQPAQRPRFAWATRDRIFVGVGILMLLAAGALLRNRVKSA